MRRVGLIAAAIGLTMVPGCAGGSTLPELHVFAASSLERVLTAWAPHIEAQLDVELRLSFAASPVVARQVIEGAPADVLITADRGSMGLAAGAGVVGERTPVARNRLALVVGASNPKRVSSVRDLRRTDLKVVLCDPAVPCGRLAAALLDKAGVEVRAVSLEENVSASLGKVALGEADVTIAYQSDVLGSRDDVEQIALPEADDRELEAVYPAAVVRRARQRAAAEAFIGLLASPEGTETFLRAGFLAP